VENLNQVVVFFLSLRQYVHYFYVNISMHYAKFNIMPKIIQVYSVNSRLKSQNTKNSNWNFIPIMLINCTRINCLEALAIWEGIDSWKRCWFLCRIWCNPIHHHYFLNPPTQRNPFSHLRQKRVLLWLAFTLGDFWNFFDEER
jgi:hypothetical protein